jgi:hypothetical protein
MRWWWFSRRPSTGGIAIDSVGAGGADRDALDDHASIRPAAI